MIVDYTGKWRRRGGRRIGHFVGAVQPMLPAAVSTVRVPVYGASLPAAVVILLAERRLGKGCSSGVVGALLRQQSSCAWPLLLRSSGGGRKGQVSIAKKAKASVNYFQRASSLLHADTP